MNLVNPGNVFNPKDPTLPCPMISMTAGSGDKLRIQSPNPAAKSPPTPVPRKNASGNSWPISVYPPLPGLIDGTPSNNNYRPGFSAGMMNKDLKLAHDCAKSVDAETPLGKMALEIYDQFCKDGNKKHLKKRSLY